MRNKIGSDFIRAQQAFRCPDGDKIHHERPKKELEKSKQYISKYDDELKETVGDKNMDIEITKYNNNAQPYYVIENSEGKIIVKQPIGYCSKEDFIKFLDEGIQNYQK